MYNFSIGDIIVHKEPNRENTPWLIVGFKTFKKVMYYKLVPVQRLDEINYPFDMEIGQIHQDYHKAI